MKTLRGKRALVTGAASGIGRAIALELAREGADVALVDIDKPGLVEVASQIEELGPTATVLRCDVSRPKDIETAVEELLDADPRLEVLINNAGVAHYGPTHRMTVEQWHRVMAVNLLAPIHFCRLLIPTLRRQPEAHLVNVSSVYGLVAHRKTAAYHASKFGLVGLTESLRAEYGREGIGVTTVCPGFVRSGLFESGTSSRQSGEKRLPKAWYCTTAENVARKTIRGIYRNKRLVLVTPLAYGVHYLKRLAPWLIDWVQHVGAAHYTGKRLAKIKLRKAAEQAWTAEEASPVPTSRRWVCPLPPEFVSGHNGDGVLFRRYSPGAHSGSSGGDDDGA